MSTNAPTRHNPAALDFLKGISLGENTPTLRKRKSLGKVASSTLLFIFFVFPPTSPLTDTYSVQAVRGLPTKKSRYESEKAGGRGSREGEKDERKRDREIESGENIIEEEDDIILILNVDAQNRANDTILFVGSSSTKKIKMYVLLPISFPSSRSVLYSISSLT